jgi:hypothetical protein
LCHGVDAKPRFEPTIFSTGLISRLHFTIAVPMRRSVGRVGADCLDAFFAGCEIPHTS